MLDAYFDETGHSEDENTKFLGIAGCLAEAAIWKKVESEWRQALKSEGLPYFHMKEYAFSQGAFKGWEVDENRRRKIYDKLWKIILNARLVPLGGFVLLENYKQELHGQSHNVFKDAYFLCYLQCLRFLEQYIEFDLISSVTTFFDDKKGFRGEAFNLYDALKHRFQDKIPQPVFRNMREFLPLQIADIVVYESKKEFERRYFKPDSKPRYGFLRLQELLLLADPDESIIFGEEDCRIALLSKDELINISKVQESITGED
jgi:hypothetical protein